MEIKQVQDTLRAHRELSSKVKKAALDKLKATEGKDKKGRDKPYIGYLIFTDFYVEDETVVVCFSFDSESPYSNPPEVILTKEEVEKL
jgi:hypothetical protein